MVKRNRQRGRPRSLDYVPPFIERNIPYFDFCSLEQLEAIEAHVDWLLADVGVEFRQDPKALDILRAGRVDVQGVTARFPDGLARKLCATIPNEFTQVARNPDKSVRIGGRNQVFAPAYGSPFIYDLKQGRRYGTIADFNNLVKLVKDLPYLHHSGGVLVEPCDVPVNKRHLDMVYGHLRYSDKPLLGMITAKERAEDSVDLAKIVFGADFMQQNVVIMGNVNMNSPMMIDKVASEAIQVYCEANQAIIVAPFILGGAMGPVTTPAGVAQALAEAMAAGAFSQLVKPGAAFVMGNFLSSMSLKSGAPTFGMPEPVMSNYMIGQLARRLGIPLRCGGSLTAAKICDAQAAFESADSMHATALAGANYVLHAAGWLEGGLAMGYEKLILDADRLGGYQRLLSGITIDSNSLAADAYQEVPAGGHFLGCSHTMANYQTAFYDAQMSDSDSYEQWQENGSKTAAERAYERMKTMLDQYEMPAIDVAIDEAMLDFIGRKKAAMDDAWY
ncbi:MAG: trimethylamine methyltransferase family protein [Pseudomonadales bacterium]